MITMLLKKKLPKIRQPPINGGIVVGFEKKKKFEKLYYLDDDVHSLIIGATRSGKTRSIILQSVGLIGLTGENMIISDPKGEIHDYTAEYLKRLNYEVITLDFKTPEKSVRYNFLQRIIDELKQGNKAKAVDLVWDITASLVHETKGEQLWRNGEISIIAGGIMAVVFDNMDRPQYQNFTNIYYFINHMCMSEPNKPLPLAKYIEKLDDNHPAKALFRVSLIAPSRTRGSFFTSALSTLSLFTNPYVYGMSCDSDFNLMETGDKKRAIFIILPDEKNTYHNVASLFVYQQYVALVEYADSIGGRLKRRVNFLLDEFGNFSRIPVFTNMLTVGGGRGMRFNLVVQSFAQIEEKYSKETCESVKDNCHCLIYLKSENPNTNAEISKRLGTYTTMSYGRSSSMSRRDGNSSNSMNIMARELLKPEEISKIKRPYLLILFSGFQPAMMKLPDISMWQFNTMFGIGSKLHNIFLRFLRNNKRPSRKEEEIKLWGIWNDYKAAAVLENIEEMNPTDKATTEKDNQQYLDNMIEDFHDINDFETSEDEKAKRKADIIKHEKREE